MRFPKSFLERQAEAARLRQALADSWAARVLEPIEGLDEGRTDASRAASHRPVASHL